jgi:hypothetical protein
MKADEYRVWPASDVAVDGEREQWAIFARWNERYEAGTAGPETHPGHGGIDARYDELPLLLAPFRQVPCNARWLVGELRFDAGARRVAPRRRPCLCDDGNRRRRGPWPMRPGVPL